MMVRFIQMMDLRLQFLDSAAVVRARQFEAPRGRGRSAINPEKIQYRGQTPAKKNERRPDPLALTDGMDEHPKLERGNQQGPGILQQIIHRSQVGEQRSQHTMQK